MLNVSTKFRCGDSVVGFVFARFLFLFYVASRLVVIRTGTVCNKHELKYPRRLTRTEASEHA